MPRKLHPDDVHERERRAENARVAAVRKVTLENWAMAHLPHPCPNSNERKQLAALAHMKEESVNYWFVNFRSRRLVLRSLILTQCLARSLSYLYACDCRSTVVDSWVASMLGVSVPRTTAERHPYVFVFRKRCLKMESATLHDLLLTKHTVPSTTPTLPLMQPRPTRNENAESPSGEPTPRRPSAC
jgi:hypothetical protein